MGESHEVVHVIGHSAYGGGVSVVHGLCEALEGLGVKPVVLASHPDVVAATEQAGVEVWQFGGIVRPVQPIRDLLAAGRLAVAFRRRGVRVVHTHTTKGGMVGRLAAWMAGCDVIIHHTHGFYHTGMSPSWKRRMMIRLERFFARFGDYQIFINTPEARDAVNTRVVPERKSRLLFNGIPDPLDEYDAAPESTRQDLLDGQGGPLVGTIGRLAIAQKGLDTALNCIALLVRSKPEVVYAAAGTGEDEEELKDLGKSLGIESSVRWLGHRSDARQLVGAFDIVLSSSRREGQSIALMEAMAWGRPIVATDIPGNVDLIESGVTGILAPVGDAEALAAGVGRLAEDPELAETLGRAARKRFEQEFTHAAYLRRAREFYAEVLPPGWVKTL